MPRLTLNLSSKLLVAGFLLLLGATIPADMMGVWRWWMTVLFVLSLLLLTVGGFGLQREVWRYLSGNRRK